MTKETKIGLLAGLAFIIVIGIVLSDHLTSSTEPPPATLAPTGNSVRGTVATPAATQAPVAVVVPPPTVQPRQPVPTASDLENQANALEVIKIGPGSSPAQQGAVVSVQSPASVQQQQQPQAVDTRTPPPQETRQAPVSVPDTQVAGADMPNNALARLAQQHGEALVAVGVGSTGNATEYTAQPGDNLSRMANRLMGGNTKANRDAILRANPSLAANPDKIIVGQVYKIPGNGTPAAPAAQTPSPAVAIAQPAQQASSSEYWYTVKEGDNLTKIAMAQLGTSNFAALKELNKDILQGGDIIHPNMRLRLPGKPIAQAN